MKTLYYTSLITLLIISTGCRSVEKLVDQGRYDEAIVLATKKLAGKKNKKTKHIQALEEAFYKVNRHDLDQVARLKDIAMSGDGSAWVRVYDYLVRIDNRQAQVSPFLPLISKDHYVGDIELIDTRHMISEARDGAAAFYYETGSNYLTEALETGDKPLAKEAYRALDRVGAYFENYKDTEELLFKSREAGITHILIEVNEFDDHGSLSRNLLDHTHKLDGMWIKYHLQPVDGLSYDLISSLSVVDISLSPEQESVRTFTETKELERWVTERDERGEIVRDTLGNEIKFKEVEIVRATLSEITRSKRAILRAAIVVTDFNQGDIVASEDFRHEVVFESDACDVRGDRRALTEGTRKRVDRTLSQFPTDYDMIDEALDKVSHDIVKYMKGWST